MNLDKLIDDLPPEGGPSQQTGDAIRREVADNIRPVGANSLSTRGLMLFAVGTVVVVVGSLAFGGPTHRDAADLAGLGLTLAAVIAMVALLSHRFGGSAHAKIAVVALLLAAWAAHVGGFCQGSSLASLYAGPTIACAARATLVGLLSAGAFAWIWRRTDPFTPRLTGALVGVAAGSVAAATMGLTCPGTCAVHMAVGHTLIVPVLGLAAYAVSPRVLTP